MIYHYQLSYDEIKDEFFAFVDNGEKLADIVYQIDETEDIIKLIKTGKMNHIDDVEGLEKFLKEKQILQQEDTIILSTRLLW